MTEAFYITSAKTEALDAATRTAIIDLCIAAHQEEDFKNLFIYVPSGGWHFLGYCAQQLVSHALVTPRWLQAAHGPLLKTAYIDAVATLPTEQGHGYGSALMQHLASAIATEYMIAALETEQPAFYARLGWELWRGPLAGRGEQGLVPTPDQHGIMILRLPQTPHLNLAEGLTIECQPGRI